MRTHEDAIAFFITHGVGSSRRVWSLGDTIVVPLGKVTADESGISTATDVVWLVPATALGWDVVQIVLMHERRQHFETLADACRAALLLRGLYQQRDRCPSCGGVREFVFGERVGPARIRWYRSTHCEACGARTEEDGGGPLPPDLRRFEIARHGLWQLRIENEQGAEAWVAIRRALALDLPALRTLKQTLPAVVREGTLGEVLSLKAELAARGVETTLSQRTG